jgi:hypothetical protein
LDCWAEVVDDEDVEAVEDETEDCDEALFNNEG